jgi:hypothetical protein
MAGATGNILIARKDFVIVEQLANCRSFGRKGVIILISDRAGKL